MFASRVTKELVIDDVTMVLRKLSAKHLEQAAEIRQLEFARYAKALSGDILKALYNPAEVAEAREGLESNEAPAQVAPLTPEQIAKKREARYAQYDRKTVLGYGIASWNAKDGTREIPVQAGIDDLDAETSERIKRCILDLSLPPLTSEEIREAEGNA